MTTNAPDTIDNAPVEEATVPTEAALKLTLAAIKSGTYEPDGEEAKAIVHAIVDLLRDCATDRVLH